MCLRACNIILSHLYLDTVINPFNLGQSIINPFNLSHSIILAKDFICAEVSV